LENDSIYNQHDKVLLTKPSKPQRNASFELLRILAMICIIAHHFMGHGGWQFAQTGANPYLMSFANALYQPAVNVFVMITAYFICTKDNMKIPYKKLGKLWITVFFYSILLFTVFTATGIYSFDKTALIQSLFPVLTGKYWFISAYFVMMIASPFLNAIIARLNKAQFTALVIFIVIISSLQDVGIWTATLPMDKGHNAVWFCLLYLIAAYIRKYDITPRTVPWIIGAVGYAAILIFVTLIWKWPRYNSVVTIYMSIFVFLTAKKVKIKGNVSNKIICFISKLTFGVYLIHDSVEMRGYMYENIFHSSAFIQTEYAFPILIGFILLTFVVCSFIEFLRQTGFNAVDKLIHKTFGDKIDSAKSRIAAFIESVSDGINASDDKILIQENITIRENDYSDLLK